MKTSSKRLSRLVVPVALVLTVVVAACGVDYNDAYTPENPPALEDAIRPYEVYLAAGCASCHGADGEGGAGPALAGHTEGQIWRQVRAPIGSMPVFSPDDLSDEDIGEIVKYVDSLPTGGPHMGTGPEVEPGEFLQMHHLMALSSLAAGSPDEADHHLEHILELVTGTHAAAIQEARDEIAAGDFKAASHIIEEMTLLAMPDLDASDLHLRLALQAASERDADTVADFLDHAAETLDDDRLGDVGAAVDAENWERAKELLIEILGLEMADGEMDMPEDDEEGH